MDRSRYFRKERREGVGWGLVGLVVRGSVGKVRSLRMQKDN